MRAIVVDDLGMSFESMSNLRQYLRKFHVLTAERSLVIVVEDQVAKRTTTQVTQFEVK